MARIAWHATSMEERELIGRIARRAVEMVGEAEILRDCGTPAAVFEMDLTACHVHVCRLDLARLVEADDGDLIHDVFGISEHLDREALSLHGCFWPRHALPATEQRVLAS